MEGDYLRGRQCYLSGPIEHGETIDWRTDPKRVLREEFGINVFDPYEDPKQQWASPLDHARQQCDYDTMASIARRFVQKDLTVVDNSNMLIAYVPYRVATTGTHHEIIRASDSKKPTMLVCPQGKQYAPLWYYGFIPHHVMFGSWEELYSYLREVNAGQHKDNRRWHYIYGMI